jgi:predicted RND superfamily exporter protein
LIDSLKKNANEIFDTAHYRVTFTGTSIIFLEGSTYIINGLIDSIILAFILIVLCMLYLFRSWKMLFISLIPNMIPLIVTAGVMGWVGVPLKPSTVLVFSIALGISIDVTIRFLVNFKQELHHHRHDISSTVRSTIHNTGLSIILTGLILFAGFMIFCFSGFGGTRALGWLTSLTLILAMITNLTILPALLLWMEKSLLKKAEKKEPLWDSLDEEDVDLHKLGLDKLETKEDRK